jgi:hypothetical protein
VVVLVVVVVFVVVCCNTVIGFVHAPLTAAVRASVATRRRADTRGHCAWLHQRPSVVWNHCVPKALSVGGNIAESIFYSPPPYLLQVLSGAPPTSASTSSNKITSTTKRDDHLRFTIADFAALTGRSLATVKQDVFALAYLTGASMDVSDDGDIHFTFSPHSKSIAMSRSFLYRVQELWRNNVFPILFGFYQVSYSVALYLSLAVVVVAITAAAIASNSTPNKQDKDQNDRKSTRHHHYHHHYHSYNNHYYHSPIMVDVSKLDRKLLFSNFFLSMYSFLFGDEDPNSSKSNSCLMFSFT